MSSSRWKSFLPAGLIGMAVAAGCSPPPAEKRPAAGGTPSATAAPSASAPQPTATTATATATSAAAPPVAPPAPPAAAVTDWPTLDQADEGFRLALPGRPESITNEVDTPSGKVYVRLYSLADDHRQRVYSIAVSRFPAPPAAGEIEHVLDRARDGALKLVGGKVLSEIDAPFGEHAGRALVVELPGGTYIQARLVVAGDRLYQVSIVSDSESLSGDDRRVFGSLEIGSTTSTEPRPQLPWRFVTPQGSTFAVEMPADPQEQVGVLNTPLGRVDLRRLEAAAAGRTFFVQSCDLPALGAAAAARLDAARDHVLRETGGRLIEETPLVLDGSEGRAIAVAVGHRTMWMRTFVDGSRIYQIGVVAQGESTPEDRRFFASLRLSERKETTR